MPYLDDINEIWDIVKESFRDSMDPVAMDLWFKNLTIKDFDNNLILFSTDSQIKYKIITEKYLDIIEKKFQKYLYDDIRVALVFDGSPTDVEKLKAQVQPGSRLMEQNRQKSESDFMQYNFEYTFDNFIVGNSNKFAHAACTAVAARPATDYNPLFIYGPSGLGKTHLMYAVTNEIKKKKPDLKILYLKSDEFTNQLIECLTRKTMDEFHNKFRNCDILLIDDIQFIAGKDSTQEEFFNTFNALYENHKQIILTSDRPPKDIKTLEDRLKSRFEWGLIADIQPPDLELRIAIIKKKAEQLNIEVSDDVLTFLAENLRSNIRQIEGSIKKLGALSFLSGKTINMELAKGCISELLGGAEPANVTVDKIFTAIYNKYHIQKEDILSNKRTKEIALARHLAIYIIRQVTDMSLPSIGKIINRDHTTVLSSIATAEKKMSSDPILNIEVAEIIKEITPG